MENRTTITEEINATFPTNNQKFITAEKVRAFMDIINDSKFNLAEDTLKDIVYDPSNTNITLDNIISELEDNIQDNKDQIQLTKTLALRFEYYSSTSPRTYDIDFPNIKAYTGDIDLISSELLDEGKVNQRVRRRYRLNRNSSRVDILPINIDVARNINENTYSSGSYDVSVEYTYDVNDDIFEIIFNIPAAGSGTYRETVIWEFKAYDAWDS